MKLKEANGSQKRERKKESGKETNNGDCFWRSIVRVDGKVKEGKMKDIGWFRAK